MCDLLSAHLSGMSIIDHLLSVLMAATGLDRKARRSAHQSWQSRVTNVECRGWEIPKTTPQRWLRARGSDINVSGGSKSVKALIWVDSEAFG